MGNRPLLYISTAIIFAAAIPFIASTQDTSQLDAFRSCAAIDSSEARLACYDKAARQTDFDAISKRLSDGERASEEAARLQAEAGMKKKKSPSGTREEKVKTFGKITIDEDRLEQIEATVTRIRPSKVSGIFIILDNAQVWQSTDKRSIPKLKAGMKVTIKRASLGSFFMKSDNSKKTMRVKRIR